MLKPKQKTDLLKALWQIGKAKEFHALGGENVLVVGRGYYDEKTGNYIEAEIHVDGVVHRGDVVVCSAEAPHGVHPNAVLYVTDDAGSIILHGNKRLTQLVIDPGDVCRDVYESLLRYGKYGDSCPNRLAAMNPFKMMSIINGMGALRMHRKADEIMGLYEKYDHNWNIVMYVWLMRTMGDTSTKEAFTKLAELVPYSTISRERNDLSSVEAIMLGAAGMFSVLDHDCEYVRNLEENFKHLGSKYKIVPMETGCWDFKNKYRYGHPALRIVETAALLVTKDFMFDGIISCRTVDDFMVLFRAEASPFWSTQFNRADGKDEIKRIGVKKLHVLGINLVVYLMFAYGRYHKNDLLMDTARELLDKIEVEDYIMLNRWRAAGIHLEHAGDSQAILELNKEYCRKGECWNCRVGRDVLREVMENGQKVCV